MWPNFRYCPDIRLEGLETENLADTRLSLVEDRGCDLPSTHQTHITYASYRQYQGKSEQALKAPRISGQSAHDGGKVVSPTHRPSLSPGDISVRG